MKSEVVRSLRGLMVLLVVVVLGMGLAVVPVLLPGCRAAPGPAWALLLLLAGVRPLVAGGAGRGAGPALCAWLLGGDALRLLPLLCFVMVVCIVQPLPWWPLLCLVLALGSGRWCTAGAAVGAALHFACRAAAADACDVPRTHVTGCM